jgi:MFS family permease
MCITLGLVKNYGGLLAVRAALGVAEGGLFPGITWFITMWYQRHECGSRMAWFFSAASAAGAFGGLLARAIMQMDHIRGLRAWSWIFILEGTATVVVGKYCFRCVVNQLVSLLYQRLWHSLQCTTTPKQPIFSIKKRKSKLFDVWKKTVAPWITNLPGDTSWMHLLTGKSGSWLSSP